ncbi:hypothetical protein F2Q70_00036834 [Brassica cretica]|uniref:Uncharacterized protein n=1 Tax=Brassica cretica TaxID=69181 RepID=A0A8S9JYN1_BRACR|nr:hypothetical protein F2Q68_00032159 [Brassica cretica]KAF2586463.1 hypothetical protein F2Q70_00036834 [Brassica cretica]
MHLSKRPLSNSKQQSVFFHEELHSISFRGFKKKGKYLETSKIPYGPRASIGQSSRSEEVFRLITCKTDAAWNSDKKTSGLGWVFSGPPLAAPSQGPTGPSLLQEFIVSATSKHLATLPVITVAAPDDRWCPRSSFHRRGLLNSRPEATVSPSSQKSSISLPIAEDLKLRQPIFDFFLHQSDEPNPVKSLRMADLSAEETRSNCLQSSSSVHLSGDQNLETLRYLYTLITKLFFRCRGVFAPILGSSKHQTLCSYKKNTWMMDLNEKLYFGEQDRNHTGLMEGVEEIKWQTYTGELTPTQEKTKEKVLKLLDKVSKTLMTWPPTMPPRYCFFGIQFHFSHAY